MKPSLPIVGLLRQVFAVLLVVVTAQGSAVACTPPAQVLEAGFYREDVSHLPRNARGVMFLLPSGKPKVSDFKITSPDDKRALALRLRLSANSEIVRLEPVGGFTPKARYTFQYLPAHEQWRYPDRMSVTIDDAMVDTAGKYAIKLARQPEVRMIVIPGSPACSEPAVALTQPFSYQIPAPLERYRKSLEYGTDVQAGRPAGMKPSELPPPGWPFQPVSYHADIYSWERHSIDDDHYTGADDLIVAPCDRQRLPEKLFKHVTLRGELSGSVAFPEVDDKQYRIAPVTIDLGRNVLGRCLPFDALTRTMQVYGGEKALKAVCARSFVFDPADATYPDRQWHVVLSRLYELSTTCKLVGLATAMSTRQYIPDRNAMSRIGAGLADGLHYAHATWLSDYKPGAVEPQFQQSVDALDYLMQKIPPDLRTDTSAMLVPLLPQLATHLSEPKPYRPDTVAALIVRAGNLPAHVRTQLEAIARSRMIGAPHARAILTVYKRK